MHLVTALGGSPAAQAHVKDIAMITVENIWIDMYLNWDDIKKWQLFVTGMNYGLVLFSEEHSHLC